MKSLPTLEGQRLILRQVKGSDVISLRDAANNPKVAYFLPKMPHPYTMKDAYSWVNRSKRMTKADSAYNFGIDLKSRGEIIGGIDLRVINLADKNAEVGYWLGVDYWGQGLASEALNLILKFAFKDLKLKRVYGFVDQRNPASIKVLEKAGFIREAVWRKASFLGRRWSDVYGYGILKEEYKVISSRKQIK
jgi:[ribosomal protein S5]-alanine N-acetyltransferase